MKKFLWGLGFFISVFMMSQLVNAAEEEKMSSYVLPGTEKLIHEVDNHPGDGEGTSAKGIIVQNPGVIKGFNPQPDPPGSTKGTVDPDEESGSVNPGDVQGFDPQPDPPGVTGKKAIKINSR